MDTGRVYRSRITPCLAMSNRRSISNLYYLISTAGWAGRCRSGRRCAGSGATAAAAPRGCRRRRARPASRTRMWSAQRICDSRWVMSRVVRPCCARRMAFWISSSVALSMALVESSRIRMRGSLRKARASARRCRCPPERVTPRSPTTVSYPFGKWLDEVVRLRVARRLLDLRLGGVWARQRRCSRRSSARTGRRPARSCRSASAGPPDSSRARPPRRSGCAPAVAS